MRVCASAFEHVCAFIHFSNAVSHFSESNAVGAVRVGICGCCVTDVTDINCQNKKKLLIARHKTLTCACPERWNLCVCVCMYEYVCVCPLA